jgi:hypothetical protein
MFPDISTGGGALTPTSSANSRSGDARGGTGASQFTFSFGGNPNASNNNTLLILGAGLVGFYLWKIKK